LSSRRQEALDYHAQGRPGKIQVTPTKPFKDQRDLSLAYTPGVAEPCLEIAKRPEDAYVYTSKSNLVAVVTNGTAVLGLGNIGALAGKPVMEGKGILFKTFADIDVFDLEVGSEKPEDVIRFCQLLEPTVGGINLEDIRSPDCFYIEQKLRATLGIPVLRRSARYRDHLRRGVAQRHDPGQKRPCQNQSGVRRGRRSRDCHRRALRAARCGARQHRDVRSQGCDFQRAR
jgi:malate dehydrogenase (oxaloacetate-decarboxylating)(NADP+)